MIRMKVTIHQFEILSHLYNKAFDGCRLRFMPGARDQNVFDVYALEQMGLIESILMTKNGDITQSYYVWMLTPEGTEFYRKSRDGMLDVLKKD